MNSLSSNQFQARLNVLERYSEAVEGFLAGAARSLEAQVEEGMRARPPAEQQDYFEAYLDDLLEMSEDLPSLLRLSLLTSLDSATEHYLVECCRSYSQMLGLAVTHADLRGPSLERSQQYLKHTVGVPFPDQTPEWTDVLRMRQLRNAVVHVDSSVDGAKRPLRDWMPKQPGIVVQHENTVTLGPEFTPHALGIYRRFGALVDASFVSKPLAAFECGFDVVE